MPSWSCCSPVSQRLWPSAVEVFHDGFASSLRAPISLPPHTHTPSCQEQPHRAHTWNSPSIAGSLAPPRSAPPRCPLYSPSLWHAGLVWSSSSSSTPRAFSDAVPSPSHHSLGRMFPCTRLTSGWQHLTHHLKTICLSYFSCFSTKSGGRT